MNITDYINEKKRLLLICLFWGVLLLNPAGTVWTGDIGTGFYCGSSM